MSHEPLSILIIDDNDARASIIEAGLRDEGHKVVTIITDAQRLCRKPLKRLRAPSGGRLRTVLPGPIRMQAVVSRQFSTQNRVP